MTSRVLLRLLVILQFSWWGASVRADELGTVDVIAIQSAVRLQIDALANDDAVSAFALTTSDTRNRLGTPDNFLRLIKEQYDPVYRHRAALFLMPEVVNGKTVQAVRLTDADSRVWLALYLMIRDAEGMWKIDGCQLIDARSVSI